MGTFKIEVQEVLARVIEVEAKDLEAAISKVNELYTKEEIVLDSDDFVSVEINEYHN
jgi:hypothetical protein